MHLNRHHFVVISAAALACVGIVAAVRPTSAAQAEGAAARPVTMNVFRGEAGSGTNIQLGSWGSGTAEASKEAVLVGTNAIKVTTAGMYQGGRLDFETPLDLTDALRNPNTFLRFQVRFTGQNAVANNFDPTSLQTSARAASPFRKMRYLVVMADGSRYELVRPVELPPSEDPDAWVPLAFPIAAIAKQIPAGKTLTGDAAKVKQLAIFGDRYAQFLIGEINVITDETEINVAPLDDIVAFALQPTVFVGNAEGGASTLKYSWDFDASDGIQEDAAGRTVYNIFQRSGGAGQKTYKVTLTVSDVDGIKKPQSTTIDLNVSD